MAIFFRVFIGLIFLVSGAEKLLSPYQNFLYVIQAYDIFPSWIEKLAAQGVPWLELIVGIFMILGLWLEVSLRASLVLFGCFIIIVGQALLRHLPIDQCGCFGENIHIPPQVILVFDSLMLLATYWLMRHLPQTKKLSLDKNF